MKFPLIIAIGSAAALLAGCAGDYAYYDGGPGIVAAVDYDGYYDNYYGPIYDGYWQGDYFYYRDRDSGHWRRDTARHFRRDSAPGYSHIQGTAHPRARPDRDHPNRDRNPG